MGEKWRSKWMRGSKWGKFLSENCSSSKISSRKNSFLIVYRTHLAWLCTVATHYVSCTLIIQYAIFLIDFVGMSIHLHADARHVAIVALLDNLIGCTVRERYSAVAFGTFERNYWKKKKIIKEGFNYHQTFTWNCTIKKTSPKVTNRIGKITFKS